MSTMVQQPIQQEQQLNKIKQRIIEKKKIKFKLSITWIHKICFRVIISCNIQKITKEEKQKFYYSINLSFNTYGI